MLEQPDAGEGLNVPIVSLKLALSKDARASLEAVRVAQANARRRARQQTMQARIWLALVVGAVVLGAVALRPQVARWRQSRAHAPEPAHAVVTAHAPEPAHAVVTAHSAEPAHGPAPAVAKPAAPALRLPEPSVPSEAEPAAAPVAAKAKATAKAKDTGVPAEGCDTTTRSGLWRRSREACARAFAADPNNASLALAVAQAEHAHAHLDEAARWAKRALALDPNAAEAYVIIARADVENGRGDDARTAYKRYLEIAPRGWHKAEARAALQRASDSPH